MMDFSSFNIINYLETKGIPYATSGKNVQEGWVGVECLFCDDPSNHLGINLDSKIYKCWSCGSKGIPTRLVQLWEQCSWAKAEAIVGAFEEKDLSRGYKSQSDSAREGGGARVEFPLFSMKNLLDPHRAWLEKRDLNSEFIFRKYNLECIGPISDWKHRLIIPIYMNRKMVAYIGRDITDKAYLPYKNCPNNEAMIPVHHCIYNIDSVKDTAIIVEGVTDVWRGGDGFVGTLGTGFTPAQVKLLSRFQRVFTLFDSGKKASDIGEQLSYELSPHVPEVEQLVLSRGDPAEFSDKEVKSLRREIFGRR